MVSEHSPNVLLHVITNQGVSGWGEASPAHSIAGETQAIGIAAARDLKPLLVGENPLEIASILGKLDYFLPHNSTTKSAIDMALFDIAAKVAGLPLYRLLGGKPRQMETDLTIGICEPEQCGAKALEVVSKGFRIIKVKVGTTLAEDCARIRNMRNAVGSDVTIRIDANQAWQRRSALDALNALGEFDIEFLRAAGPRR